MLLVTAVKTFVFGGCMIPIAFGALGTSIIFGSYLIALARNPEENELLFNGTLMGFALIETFVFMSFGLGFIIYII